MMPVRALATLLNVVGIILAFPGLALLALADQLAEATTLKQLDRELERKYGICDEGDVL